MYLLESQWLKQFLCLDPSIDEGIKRPSSVKSLTCLSKIYGKGYFLTPFYLIYVKTKVTKVVWLLLIL